MGDEHLLTFPQKTVAGARPEETGVRLDLVITGEPGAELGLDVGERRHLAEMAGASSRNRRQKRSILPRAGAS
ncbi:MAG: hypothetical protein U0359_11255 [Byssovorax sp.]